MKENPIFIPAKINGKIFREFAWFDAFVHQKRWTRLLFFVLALAIPACLCLAFQDRRQGAVLLGIVLLSVGFGLPLVYLWNFSRSLRQQIKRLGLEGEKIIYTLRIEERGIHVADGTQTADYLWESVYAVYRRLDCVYLYVTPRKAYLIPRCSNFERAWESLENHLPPEKLWPARK